jgi:hypothetical protein
MAKALAGDDRPAHGLTLTPSLALSDFTQQQSAPCAQASERVLDPLDTLGDPATPPLPPPTTPHRPPPRNAPACDLRTQLDRITGVDLTQVPG